MKIILKIRNFVWRKYIKEVFKPLKINPKKDFWKWVYDCLLGNFLVKTPWGVLGLEWYGFLNFEIYLGRLCRIIIDREKKEFLINFIEDHSRFEHPVSSVYPITYYHWVFGHTLGRIKVKSEDGTYKFVQISEWRWGRYNPDAPEKNVKLKGKILGIGIDQGNC